jgi:hypothetical protein
VHTLNFHPEAAGQFFGGGKCPAAFSICQLPVTAFGRFFVWLDSFGAAVPQGMALVQEIIAIVRQVASGLPPEPQNSWMMVCLAAKWLPQTRRGIGFCRLSCGACQSEGFMVPRGCRMKSSKRVTAILGLDKIKAFGSTAIAIKFAESSSDRRNFPDTTPRGARGLISDSPKPANWPSA